MSMIKENAEQRVKKVLELMPKGLEEEILRLCSAGRASFLEISEIRVRAFGRCSVRLFGRSVGLSYKASSSEIRKIVEKLCFGALYAHRDNILKGYIPFSNGIRVGVAGSARYEGGRAVGIEEISSLVFRLPTKKCELSAEILSAFCLASRGLIIYSPPGGGKTSALRSLSKSLGCGESPLRVCVIDEREEFSCEDYSCCEVDLLCGYKKQTGIEIATRTLSPDVVVIDEIGSDEASEVALAVRCGVKIAATAHARTVDELLSKPSLKPLFDAGAFDVTAGILTEGGKRRLEVVKI